MYHLRLTESPSLAQKELDLKLKLVEPPRIYTDWDDTKEYKAIPKDIRSAFGELVRAVKDGDDTVPPAITILGEPGVGKTRTIFALARHLLGKHWFGEKLFRMEFEPQIMEHVEWVQMVRNSNRFGDNDSRSQFVADVKQAQTFPGFLFLDDIGVSAMPDYVAESFYTLIDQRLKHRRPTIFVSNATPQELARAVDPRISHRLVRWTKVITFQA